MKIIPKTFSSEKKKLKDLKYQLFKYFKTAGELSFLIFQFQNKADHYFHDRAHATLKVYCHI